MSVLRYHRTAELPELAMWLEDDAGALIDFSSGWSFELKIGTPGSPALLTKTTGIAGAVGAGSEPDGDTERHGRNGPPTSSRSRRAPTRGS